uniref:Uncharacterized protein n=1 Tax=Romanomermis culicivorax TaxID=13658 RepID=A0A915K380_ROMCU
MGWARDELKKWFGQTGGAGSLKKRSCKMLTYCPSYWYGLWTFNQTITFMLHKGKFKPANFFRGKEFFEKIDESVLSRNQMAFAETGLWR